MPPCLKQRRDVRWRCFCLFAPCPALTENVPPLSFPTHYLRLRKMIEKESKRRDMSLERRRWIGWKHGAVCVCRVFPGMECCVLQEFTHSRPCLLAALTTQLFHTLPTSPPLQLQKCDAFLWAAFEKGPVESSKERPPNHKARRAGETSPTPTMKRWNWSWMLSLSSPP